MSGCVIGPLSFSVFDSFQRILFDVVAVYRYIEANVMVLVRAWMRYTTATNGDCEAYILCTRVFGIMTVENIVQEKRTIFWLMLLVPVALV